MNPEYFLTDREFEFFNMVHMINICASLTLLLRINFNSFDKYIGCYFLLPFAIWNLISLYINISVRLKGEL